MISPSLLCVVAPARPKIYCFLIQSKRAPKPFENGGLNGAFPGGFLNHG